MTIDRISKSKHIKIDEKMKNNSFSFSSSSLSINDKKSISKLSKQKKLYLNSLKNEVELKNQKKKPFLSSYHNLVDKKSPDDKKINFIDIPKENDMQKSFILDETIKNTRKDMTSLKTLDLKRYNSVEINYLNRSVNTLNFEPKRSCSQNLSKLMLEKKKKCKEPESKKSLKFNSMINLDKHSNSINFQTRNDLKLDVPYKKIKTQIQDLEAIGEIDYLNQIKSVKTNTEIFAKPLL